MIVNISTLLDTSADRAWDAVKKTATLLHVTRGMLGFTGAEAWPDEWREGSSTSTRFVFFHLLPAPWRHELRVVRISDNERQIYSNERGGVIRRWNHLIQIEPRTGPSCRYADRIEIDAGPLTPLVWAYAHVFYRYRQMRWRRLARSLA